MEFYGDTKRSKMTVFYNAGEIPEAYDEVHTCLTLEEAKAREEDQMIMNDIHEAETWWLQQQIELGRASNKRMSDWLLSDEYIKQQKRLNRFPSLGWEAQVIIVLVVYYFLLAIL